MHSFPSEIFLLKFVTFFIQYDPKSNKCYVCMLNKYQLKLCNGLYSSCWENLEMWDIFICSKPNKFYSSSFQLSKKSQNLLNLLLRNMNNIPLLVVLLLTLYNCNSSSSCPSGWIPFGSSCYMISSYEMSWYDAQKVIRIGVLSI